MNEKKKLEFYGGEWMSFLPFVLFLGIGRNDGVEKLAKK